MPYFVYILTNKSNTLYVGSTKDPNRRINEHIRKRGPKFTAKYNINKLIYLAEFNTLQEVIVMEKKIKGWTRKKKINLIKTINPEFRNLSETSSEILR